jgi:hypothetical protein
MQRFRYQKQHPLDFDKFEWDHNHTFLLAPRVSEVPWTSYFCEEREAHRGTSAATCDNRQALRHVGLAGPLEVMSAPKIITRALEAHVCVSIGLLSDPNGRTI